MEIGAIWTRWGGDWHCLDSVRWTSTLFGPSEVEIGTVWTQWGGDQRCLDFEWISKLHVTQSATALALHVMDAKACSQELAFYALLSALIFWALIFLELIREKENGGRGTLLKGWKGEALSWNNRRVWQSAQVWDPQKGWNIWVMCSENSCQTGGVRNLGYFK